MFYRRLLLSGAPWVAGAFFILSSPLTKGTSVITEDLPAIAQKADIIADVTVVKSTPYCPKWNCGQPESQLGSGADGILGSNAGVLASLDERD
jgi:hypothetical protein